MYGIADAVRPESKQVIRRVIATECDARNQAYARAFLNTEVASILDILEDSLVDISRTTF